MLKLKKQIAALPETNSVGAEKSAQLDRILQSCLGLEIETTLLNSEVVPGEKMELHHSAVIHSSLPVRWIGTRYPGINEGITSTAAVNLTSNQPAKRDETMTLPPGTPLSQPYWLREESAPGTFRVDDAALIGTPENPPAFPVEQVFEIGGQTLVISDEPVQIITNSANAEIRRKLDVIPPVSLKFASDVELFAPGKMRAGCRGNHCRPHKLVRHVATGNAGWLEGFAGGT